MAGGCGGGGGSSCMFRHGDRGMWLGKGKDGQKRHTTKSLTVGGGTQDGDKVLGGERLVKPRNAEGKGLRRKKNGQVELEWGSD